MTLLNVQFSWKFIFETNCLIFQTIYFSSCAFYPSFSILFCVFYPLFATRVPRELSSQVYFPLTWKGDFLMNNSQIFCFQTQLNIFTSPCGTGRLRPCLYRTEGVRVAFQFYTFLLFICAPERRLPDTNWCVCNTRKKKPASPVSVVNRDATSPWPSYTPKKGCIRSEVKQHCLFPFVLVKKKIALK